MGSASRRCIVRRKIATLLVAIFLVLPIAFATAGGQQESGSTDDMGPVELELWTFQEVHISFYERMAELWNEQNPDRQIVLNATAYPYGDMHNNLLVALQSGSGAPDIVDIEISRFPNFLRGNVQLRDMSDFVDPVRDDFVEARFDIYSQNDAVYGLPFHVGLSVMYYNTAIMDQAGVDIDAIDTWDDYIEAGRQVVENTDAWMTTVEATEQWSFWPLITQQQSNIFGSDGSVTLDNQTNIDTLQMLHDMVYEHEIARTTPGGFHHAEEYYGFMAEGGAASIWMPLWYMGRFTDYMDDLQGNVAIRPLPRFSEGGFRSAGMGGTGTAVPIQGEHVELAAEFLAYAKLSEEGNILLWEELGFDPPRSSVWTSDELAQENKYTDFFTNGTQIFEQMLPLTEEIHPVNVTTQIPDAITLIQTEVMPRVLSEQSATPAEALRRAADQLRN
jgi:arabinosaccharide transport system substrate-binding protein